MKKLLLLFIGLTVATAFAPAFAGIRDARNKAECEKAGGTWIDKDNKCGFLACWLHPVNLRALTFARFR